MNYKDLAPRGYQYHAHDSGAEDRGVGDGRDHIRWT
jgi:hypothetical protein